MNSTIAFRLWSRQHDNGFVSVVYTANLHEGQFGFCALKPGTANSVGVETSFDDAKQAADYVSTCAQPCTCKPWPD